MYNRESWGKVDAVRGGCIGVNEKRLNYKWDFEDNRKNEHRINWKIECLTISLFTNFNPKLKSFIHFLDSQLP